MLLRLASRSSRCLTVRPNFAFAKYPSVGRLACRPLSTDTSSTPPPPPPPPVKRSFFVDPLRIRFVTEKALRFTGLGQDEDVIRLTSLGVSLLAYGSIGASALGTMGVDTSPLLAGVSVTGVTIGFALRDFLSNLVAGFMLVAVRPRKFHRGDRVIVGTPAKPVEGTVVEFDMRNLILEITAEDKTKGLAHVPMSVVYGNPIAVFSPPNASRAIDR